MKKSVLINTTMILVLAGGVALGLYSLHRLSRFQEQLAYTDAQLGTAEQRLQARLEAEQKAAFAEQKAEILQKTLTDTSALTAEQSRKVEQLQQSLAAAESNSAGNLLAGMFKDPKVKELMKSQQKAFMGPMIDQQYGALFQQLNLTPEQTAYVKDLLQQRMLASADMGFSMLGGDMDAGKRKELAQQVKEHTEEIDAQIKQFLGDENYQAFKDYEKSASDRMTVSQFSDQLAGTPSALTPEQEKQLVQAMQDERAGFKWTVDYGNRDSADFDFATFFTEERLKQYAQDQERFDRELIERVRGILTPDQWLAYEKSLAAWRDLQINSLKLASQMFAPRN